MKPLFDLRKQLERYFLGILIIVIIAYGFFRIYPLLAGPDITIIKPKDGEIISSPTFEISGHVSRVKNISIQGRSIPIDKEGNFNELLVLFPPYTTVIINAADFYNKSVTKTITVRPKDSH